MQVIEATNAQSWDSFLSAQTFRPFLQSWTMGEVYRDTAQEPIRLEVRDEGKIIAICLAILVPARRGRHLSIPYGPVINYQLSIINYQIVLEHLIAELTKIAREHRCSFIRMSPFWPEQQANILEATSSIPVFQYSSIPGSVASPLHLLAEHLWYLPLVEPDPWSSSLVLTSIPQPLPHSITQTSIPRPLPPGEEGEHLWASRQPQTHTSPLSSGEGVRGRGLCNEKEGVRGERLSLKRGLGGEVEFKREIQLKPRTEEELLMAMRKTTRNLIRRAERDGVVVEASQDPNREIEHFLALHEETRHRHGFTPYTDVFFRSQVRRFAERGECTLYLARFQGEVAAASIHMHTFGETSYHHGASTHRLSKVPTSYLLQWTAIRDALKRGDHVYNFWGIAPLNQQTTTNNTQQTVIALSPNPQSLIPQSHPFAGVTLFKTGFGGSLLPLTHCMDFPLSARYHLTRAFELLRKWRRGF